MKKHVVAIRAGWMVTVLALTVMFVASIPAVYAHKLAPSAPVQAGLDQLGFSNQAFAASRSLVQIIFGGICLSVGTAIVTRRPAERVAWLMSLFVIAVGTANAPNLEALAVRWPDLVFVATLGSLVLIGSLVLLLFLFPDGRWVPGWAAPLAALLVVVTLVLRGSVAGPPSEAMFLALVFSLVAGLAAQGYRYFRVSSGEERLQTKQVGLAFAVAIAAQILFPALEGVRALARPGVGALALDLGSVIGISLGFSLIPIALAHAILKHRLWSLDVVINRTLVYGGLTAVLLVVYVGVAGGLGGTISADRNLL